MKNITYVRIGAIVLISAGVATAVLLAGHHGLVAGEGRTPPTLSQVPAPEIPELAARLVAQAPPESREAKALEVVRTFNAVVQPASLPYVVSAISQRSPEVAAAVVAEAAALHPEWPRVTPHAPAAAAPLPRSAKDPMRTPAQMALLERRDQAGTATAEAQELALRLPQASAAAAPLARPAKNPMTTPMQTVVAGRLGQAGIAKPEAQAAVQLAQPSIPVAAVTPPVATPAASTGGETKANVVAPAGTTFPIQNNQVAQANRAGATTLPTPTPIASVTPTPTTSVVPTQQGPGSGPGLTLPPPTPITPVTPDDTKESPGPNRDYSAP